MTKSLLDIVSTNPALCELPKVKERLNMLREVLADIEDHFTTSPCDEDARVGHKSEDSSFFGYKTHIAMSQERIITAATVTSGEKADGKELPELIEQSRQNGMEVDTVVGDRAYSGKDNIVMSEDEKKGFELMSRLQPHISQGIVQIGHICLIVSIVAHEFESSIVLAPAITHFLPFRPGHFNGVITLADAENVSQIYGESTLVAMVDFCKHVAFQVGYAALKRCAWKLLSYNGVKTFDAVSHHKSNLFNTSIFKGVEDFAPSVGAFCRYVENAQNLSPAFLGYSQGNIESLA